MHNFDPHDKEACPIWDTVQEAKAFRQMTDGMKYFLGAVGIVTLFLGGLGVMNVMMVAVRERTREIGVRKALGAPAGTILKQFFIEALLIAFISGAIGMGIAYGICFLVNLLPMPDFFAGGAALKSAVYVPGVDEVSKCGDGLHAPKGQPTCTILYQPAQWRGDGWS